MEVNQPKDSEMTEREVQVLRLVAQGLTNQQVACKLNITERTIEYHLSEIFQRLEVSSRTAAVLKAEKMKLLDV